MKSYPLGKSMHLLQLHKGLCKQGILNHQIVYKAVHKEGFVRILHSRPVHIRWHKRYNLMMYCIWHNLLNKRDIHFRSNSFHLGNNLDLNKGCKGTILSIHKEWLKECFQLGMLPDKLLRNYPKKVICWDRFAEKLLSK
jgi:hypothetical protein